MARGDLGELPELSSNLLCKSLRQMVAEPGLPSLRDGAPTTYLLMEPRAGLGAQKAHPTHVFLCVMLSAGPTLGPH